jgi:excisionase family DNA binding protein
MVAAGEREPRSIPLEERQALTELARALDRADGTLSVTVGDTGRTFELPDAAARLLRDIVHALARGRAVSLHSVGDVLTTQEAADLLNVSRPYVVKILERGDIPFEWVGTHRRVRLEDLLAYRRRRDAERRAALDRLTQISQELGLYDMEIDEDDLLDERA